MRDVYGAYYRASHVRLEMHRIRELDGETAKRLVLALNSHSLFAFAGEGRGLPELADAVRDAVRQALGLQGRPGIAVSVVYGRLAEHLPEDRAAPFRSVDWEALAEQLAEQALAEAKPGFVKAYASLRDLTSRYAEVPDLELAAAGAPNEECGLPSCVPEDTDRRMDFLARENGRCMDMMASCLELRQSFVDMLHQKVNDAVMNYALPLMELEELRSDAFLLWFEKEAAEDLTCMLEEFSERFAASGRGFDVFMAYWNRVGLMARNFRKAGTQADFYQSGIKRLYDFIEGRRVVPDGAW